MPPTPLSYELENTDESLPYSALALPLLQPGANNSGSASAVSSLSKRVALSSIRKVLGDFRPDDPVRYRQSLDRSWTLSVKDGHVEGTWKPAGWTGASNPADLTGAMAVFYSYAQSSVSQLKDVLAQMEPMCTVGPAKPDLCCEDVRDVIRSRLDEVVGALAAPDGPCAERVDQVLNALGRNSSEPSGLIAILKDNYVKDPSLDGEGICCPDDARRLAQFELFAGSIECLHERWCRFKDEFLGNGKGAIAFRIGNAQRYLRVIAATVADLVRGLNLSGYSAAARDITNIGEEIKAGEKKDACKHDRHPPTLGCVLSWMRDFAQYRAPGLLQRPGRGSFQTLEEEASELAKRARELEKWADAEFSSDAIRQSIGGTHIATGALALKGVVLGIPSAAERLRRQIECFEQLIKQLSGGCDPLNSGLGGDGKAGRGGSPAGSIADKGKAKPGGN